MKKTSAKTNMYYAVYDITDDSTRSDIVQILPEKYRICKDTEKCILRKSYNSTKKGYNRNGKNNHKK